MRYLGDAMSPLMFHSRMQRNVLMTSWLLWTGLLAGLSSHSKLISLWWSRLELSEMFQTGFIFVEKWPSFVGILLGERLSTTIFSQNVPFDVLSETIREKASA